MSQSLAQVFVHIIYSTKGRLALLADPEIRRQMHAYLATVFAEYQSPAQIIGGTADHVHILCAMSRETNVAKLVGESKRNSSKWVKTKGPLLTRFQWQNGYGAFSVSYSNLQRVRDYISRQETHHATHSYQDEFRAFLRKHRVDYDERYVWD